MTFLTDSQQMYLVRSFEGLPASVRADCHKYVADTLRAIPHAMPDDLRRAVDAALVRNVGRQGA